MATIFLSYARTDAVAVAVLHETLTASGHTMWIDVAALPEASPWREEIALAIERSDIFLFAVSEASLRSIECRKEFEHARNLHARLRSSSAMHQERRRNRRHRVQRSRRNQFIRGVWCRFVEDLDRCQ